jgi:hypothetical protein
MTDHEVDRAEGRADAGPAAGSRDALCSIKWSTGARHSRALGLDARRARPPASMVVRGPGRG